MSGVPQPDLVTVETADRVAILSLNNAARRNALSRALLDALIAGLKGLDLRDVRAVILRAAPGLSVWSAGHDIKELPRGHEDPLGYSDPLERALRAIREMPVPVIAMVHGTVWGGAFDLVLSCDMIVADETAGFAITPVNLGLPYNTTGLLHFIGRLPMNLIKEMFFTATPLKAEDAERWHIVNHLVPSAELESFTMALAEGMTTKAPMAVAVIKEQLRVLADYQPIAAQVFERIQDMRRQVYESADFQEGINAFLEKRKAVFQGI
ncbi:methylmalonyl-CoA decarboxylase [Inquilinus limosus]|uniref:methylmalonyl-CoA decarboxylase n=1 Tax=Inquilinus limosus TaxID=171674 RepID=UPI00068F1959|nr:methylmalonyl-CoA decarboxylase [Inquilinus limosus]